jgi:hypothetical protein
LSHAHPDHRKLHDAFLLAAKNVSPNVRSLFYEDLPCASFGPATADGFKALLEIADGVFITERAIELTAQQLSEKLAGIQDYASQILTSEAPGRDFLKIAEHFARSRCEYSSSTVCAREVTYELDRFNTLSRDAT